MNQAETEAAIAARNAANLAKFKTGRDAGLPAYQVSDADLGDGSGLDDTSDTHTIGPGSHTVSGAKDIAAGAEAWSHQNDAAQGRNAAAMAGSAANMRGPSPFSASEDAASSKAYNDTRNQQLQSLELNKQAALGNAPSEAEAQTRMDMNGMMGQRAGEMGSSRSLAGLSGAQVAGAQGVGQAASGASLAGGMGRSKEIGEAMGMYGSQAGQVRGNDMMRLDAGNKMAMGNAGRADAWKVGNANLLANQGKLGVDMRQSDDAWFDTAADPAYRQFSYDQEAAAAQAGVNMGDYAARVAEDRAKAAERAQLVGGITQAGLTAVGSMAGPAGAAGGGMLGSTINSATRKYY